MRPRTKNCNVAKSNRKKASGAARQATTADHHPSTAVNQAAVDGMLARLRELLCRAAECCDALARAVNNSPTNGDADGHSEHSANSEKATNAGVSSLMREQLITMLQAAEIVPTTPKPSPSTLARWSSTGVRGVRLETVLMAGRRKTSREAVERFLAAVRAQDFGGLHSLSAAQIERAVAAAERLKR